MMAQFKLPILCTAVLRKRGGELMGAREHYEREIIHLYKDYLQDRQYIRNNIINSL